MRCEQSERWISLGADQELSVQEVSLLRDHLTECASCRTLSDETRDMQRWFVTPPQEPVPPGFAERVVAAAFDGQVTTAKGPRGLVQSDGSVEAERGNSSIRGFLLQMTALAALLLVALGFALAGKQASESRDMVADEVSLESLILEMDQENVKEAKSDPKDESKEDSNENEEGDTE
ncbi:MAG: zf-HC2 domain-containing protein [bacterium]|nr:zf-HC2 domain-containing protein [bacterium]